MFAYLWSLSSLSSSFVRSCRLLGGHTCKVPGRLEPHRPPLFSYLVFSHHLLPLESTSLSLYIMESRNNTVSPQPGTVTPQSSGGIRRHHTISSSSRTSRTGSKLIDDEQTVWNGHEDEVVDNDWVGGVGHVGDKSASLHRQTSLPTRHPQRRESLLNLPIHHPSEDLADHF